MRFEACADFRLDTVTTYDSGSRNTSAFEATFNDFNIAIEKGMLPGCREQDIRLTASS